MDGPVAEQVRVNPSDDKVFGVRISADEKPRQPMVGAAGGTWDCTGQSPGISIAELSASSS